MLESGDPSWLFGVKATNCKSTTEDHQKNQNHKNCVHQFVFLQGFGPRFGKFTTFSLDLIAALVPEADTAIEFLSDSRRGILHISEFAVHRLDRKVRTLGILLEAFL